MCFLLQVLLPVPVLLLAQELPPGLVLLPGLALQVQELLPGLVLPRRNAESGCNHLLFQALLHTVFR